VLPIIGPTILSLGKKKVAHARGRKFASPAPLNRARGVGRFRGGLQRWSQGRKMTAKKTEHASRKIRRTPWANLEKH